MLVWLGWPNAFSTSLTVRRRKKQQTEQRPHSNESASSCTKSKINNNNNNSKHSQHAGTHKSKKFAVNSRINLLTFGSSVASRRKTCRQTCNMVALKGTRSRDGWATSGTSARSLWRWIETVSMCQQQMFGRCGCGWCWWHVGGPAAILALELKRCLWSWSHAKWKTVRRVCLCVYEYVRLNDFQLNQYSSFWLPRGLNGNGRPRPGTSWDRGWGCGWGSCCSDSAPWLDATRPRQQQQ